MQRAGVGGRGRVPARGAGLLAGLAVLTAMSAASAAPPAPEFETLRVGYSNNSRNNLFKVGTWTPAWVQIKGGNTRFSGTLEIEVPDDDGTPTTVSQPIEVAPMESPRVIAYVRPGSRSPEVELRLRDANGRVVARGGSMTMNVAIDPIFPNETLLLTIGNPSGVDQVGGLPGFTSEKNGGGEIVTVGKVDVTGNQMPGRWLGYDAADAVVLDTNDRDVIEALGLRGQALVDWVSRGGHLVVGVGANWQTVRDSALGPILPAVLAGQERVTSLDGFDTFIGSTINPITPPGTPPTLATKFEQIEARGGRVMASVGTVPLVVRGIHGFGRVTLIGVDVNARPFAEWKNRAQFWQKAIDLRRPASETGNNAVRVVGGRRLTQTGISDLSTQLRQALEQFPGVKLVPFGWVAFFIFLYILLIGPGDYLFLKKVVKRMELTWITFPLIVLGVSLAAYIGAYFLKGNELRVNKVDVVDIDQAQPGAVTARGHTYFNLFSPQNRDYDIQVVPEALDQPATKADGATGTKPVSTAAPGTEVLVSWLGVPEPGFGGMSSSNQVGFIGAGYRYDRSGATESIAGLRIPIWSTKCLAGSWFGPAAAVAESDLVPVGSDRLNGTVTNTLDVPLKNAIVAFGRHVYELGDLAPGVPVRVELSRDRQLPGLLRDRGRRLVPGAEFDPAAGGRIDRADLALTLMFHNSQGTATSDPPLPSDPLHYLDLTGLLTLDRPMLVGRIDRPGAQLVLGNAPAEPRVDQTTMLRVLLPLGKPAR